MTRMRTIKSLEELSSLVKDQYAQGVELFVRTSSGIANDRKMGCSTNHASGQREAGISTLTMTPHVEALGVGDLRVVGDQAQTIGYMGAVTYLLTGDVIAHGSDGEPILDAVTWQPVAMIDADAIREQRRAICDHTRIERADYRDADGRLYRYCLGCGAKVYA